MHVLYQAKSFYSKEQPDYAQRYVDLVSELVNHPVAGQGLLALDLHGLLAKNALISVIVQGEQVISGVHTHLEQSGTRYWISGLVTRAEHAGRGFATKLIKIATEARAKADANELEAIATVRLYANGELNEASRKAFVRNGFFQLGVRRYKLEELEEAGSHLLPTVEIDNTVRALVVARYPWLETLASLQEAA